MKQKGIKLLLLLAIGLLGGTSSAIQPPQTVLLAQATAADPPVAPPDSPTPPAEEEQPAQASRHGRSNGKIQRNTIVEYGRDVELKSNEVAEVVVVFGGNAKIYGTVEGAVVCIGGNAEIYGEVQETAVAIFGNIHIGATGKVADETVAVGGTVSLDDGAIASHIEQVNPPFLHGLKNWLLYCVFPVRPLAPQVGWVWVVSACFFGIYLLLTAIFPQAVQTSVDELKRRPITTALIGVLVKLLLPLVVLLIAFTVVGVIVVPFALAGIVVGWLVGKAAFLQWVGLRLGTLFGGGAFERPVVGLLLGGVVINLIYMVPFLGLLAFIVTGVWGLGAAAAAALAGLKREMPEKSASLAVPTGGLPVGIGGAPSGLSATGGNPGAGEGAFAATGLGAGTLAIAERRAGFWERMGAGFLDMVILVTLGALIQKPPFPFILALAYFAGMWGWKGTTIGGIVLNLKVVREDGGPVSFLVSLVRALAAAFSMIMLFLGFFWIAWDREKQGWHDKIAGTVVLRLPRGTPLV